MEPGTEITPIPGYNPVSSYRIQFSRDFTLNDLEKHVDYISRLGVGSIYASPVFAAVAGSNHGYDVINPGMINPELGTFEDFTRVVKLFREKNIGWIQDIVPNHMAYHPDNPWIWDLLEKGPCSHYSEIFDLEPSATGPKARLMVPFLGDTAGTVIQEGELQFCMHRGSVAIKYYDSLYPVNFNSFRSLFSSYIPSAPGAFTAIWEKYDLSAARDDIRFLNKEWEAAKNEMNSLLSSDETIKSYTDTILTGLNNNPQLKEEILSGQHYELCWWKETSQRINYRRFFTINSLICIRIEDKKVFKKHHKYLAELLSGGYLTGLRVDHIDGLHDPGRYLRRLRSLAGKEKYLIVEKILERGENIPISWPVEGTTGYDFLALANNLLTRKKNYKKLIRLYSSITGREQDAGQMVYDNKKFILDTSMQGELDNLFGYLEKLFVYAAEQGIASYNDKKGITRDSLREALAAFMLAFPVYRHYHEEFPLNGESREMCNEVFEIAIGKRPEIKSSLILFRDLIFAERTGDNLYNRLLADLCLRVMQFTGPLTAKGLEDTTMYQYNCFVAHNEVGDHPGSQGISADQFHEAMTFRLAQSPLAMNATSTHDTKRGEDVRARLNAIGDMAGEWEQLVKKWIAVNAGLKFKNGKNLAPTPNEEYLIYQTLAGTFPFDEKTDEVYLRRIREYLVKALREAKQTSNWEDPDENHEQGVCDFAVSLLDPRNNFLASFLPFHRKLVWRGIVNSLVQLVVKCCSPGTPDIYRGTESWDLSLVDPDNRRPVDFDRLSDTLNASITRWKADPLKTTRELYNDAFDGKIKILLSWLLLSERKNNPELFHSGDYIPITASGKYKEHVLGFVRKSGDSWLMCILPLHTGELSSLKKGEYLSSVKWKDTVVTLPPGVPEEWENLLTGEKMTSRTDIDIARILGDLPVAVFRGKNQPSGRYSGILLHVSSLPGKYGIGDFDEEAYRFVDFLSRNNQTYWQTLPLAPLTKAQSWSPYASPSAFAGNTLLVSPRMLYVEGLLNYSDLENSGFTSSGKVNYEKALRFREALFEKAWDKFRKDTEDLLYREYEEFCKNESWWLEDYSLFIVLRHNYGNRDWGRWPSEVKSRERKTIKTACYEYAESIMLEKFKQFMFDRQWKNLKEYANKKGIRIFGDIPYYVSYDSAEVWANQDLFNLDRRGRMKTVAGVPPDYFDKNGQLWNMPVYDWNRLKETGYHWWLKRLARNLEYFDLLRLDHFRAFSAYWEVPAKDKVAVNGKWSPGPGSEFFRAVELEFPAMPFVAEDLGDIDQPVYDLRDEFFLPGMQVLQFSFDDNMARNLHTPHNHKFNSLVYTGTHDNNTLQGWYERELGRDGKNRLIKYAGKKIRKSELNREIIRMAFASPAEICIIPMQDYLEFGRDSRMNTPSTSRGNWIWKLKTAAAYEAAAEMMNEFTVMFNRR